MERPTGVTVIAILQFIAAGFLVLGGLGLLLMGAGGAAIIKGGSGGGAFLAGLGIFGAIALFIFAAIYLALGIGMWNLKNWARIICLFLLGLGLLAAVPSALGAILHFNIIALFLLVLRFGIGIVVFWYLLQPEVKKAFGAQGF